MPRARSLQTSSPTDIFASVSPPYALEVTPYELELRDTDDGDVTLVELAGELDLTNANEIERRLRALADRGSGLALDLNRITFVDSAALHMLFRIARWAGTEKRVGIVLEPTALVAKTLTIVGLDEVADIRATVDELVVQTTD